MTVDFASLADLPLLLQFEAACFPQQPWAEDALTGCFTDDRYLVLLLKVENRPVGYLIGWHVFEEAELARIGVFPELRGQGYGRILLDFALREWQRRGVEQAFLDVRAGNSAALALYEKTGFERVGLRRNYYGDEDAVLMALNLKVS